MNPSAFHVRQSDVGFTSNGISLRGHLFEPPDFDPARTYPSIVIAPTWTSVKEQMADLYARRLAEHGYVTLAFDFRFYGESGGMPRNYENPAAKIIDIQNAVTFLQSLPIVDGSRIGGLGICAGAGYMADAVAVDNRIRSVALVAPWLHSAALVRTIYGGEEGVQQRLTAAATARQQYEATGEVVYVPAISTTDQNAAMFGDFDYYLNPQRGAIPQWGNQFFVWLAGSQFDFYDQEPNVTRSVEEVTAHFNATLGGQAAHGRALEAELQATHDHQAVVDTVSAVGLYADLRQWDRVQAQFADQVVLDYTSYAQAAAGASQPDALTPAEVVAAWQRVLLGYDHTQHLITSHQVVLRGNEAEVVSSIYATHNLAGAAGGDSWVFIGDYQHRLVRTEQGWKTTHMQANLRAQLGNPNLPAIAEQPVQQQTTTPKP